MGVHMWYGYIIINSKMPLVCLAKGKTIMWKAPKELVAKQELIEYRALVALLREVDRRSIEKMVLYENEPSIIDLLTGRNLLDKPDAYDFYLQSQLLMYGREIKIKPLPSTKLN